VDGRVGAVAVRETAIFNELAGERERERERENVRCVSMGPDEGEEGRMGGRAAEAEGREGRECSRMHWYLVFGGGRGILLSHSLPFDV